MNSKQKIEELKRRIRDLEARPVILPIILQPPHPDCYPLPYVYPQPLPWPGYPQPYIGDPIYIPSGPCNVPMVIS